MMFADTLRQISNWDTYQEYKDRQTYFGALDYQTKFIVQGVSVGNSASTIEFVKHLRSQRSEQKNYFDLGWSAFVS